MVSSAAQRRYLRRFAGTSTRSVPCHSAYRRLLTHVFSVSGVFTESIGQGWARFPPRDLGTIWDNCGCGVAPGTPGDYGSVILRCCRREAKDSVGRDPFQRKEHTKRTTAHRRQDAGRAVPFHRFITRLPRCLVMQSPTQPFRCVSQVGGPPWSLHPRIIEPESLACPSYRPQRQHRIRIESSGTKSLRTRFTTPISPFNPAKGRAQD